MKRTLNLSIKCQIRLPKELSRCSELNDHLLNDIYLKVGKRIIHRNEIQQNYNESSQNFCR